MKKSAFILCLVILISACKGEKKNDEVIVQQNDFESLVGWVDVDQTRLLKGNAHSGQYCALTDSLHPYSIGFIRKLKDISERKIQKIEMSVWVLAQNLDANASFVLSIESGGKPVFWKGVKIQDNIQSSNKWYHMKCRYAIPKDISPENEVRIYVWNTGEDVVLADDFELKFYN